MQGFQQDAQRIPDPFSLKDVNHSSPLQDIRQNTRLTPDSSGYYLPKPPHLDYEASRKRTVEAAAEAAKVAQKEELEKIDKEYDKAFERNLWEMDFGPDCACNRHQWQHELHPSGRWMSSGRMRSRIRDRQREGRFGIS
jgi:hypothetical protein